MLKLIIDIGNSALKGCYGNDNIFNVRIMEYSKKEFTRDFLLFLNKFDKKPLIAYLVTQNPNLIPKIRRPLNKKFQGIQILVPKINFNYPFKVRYEKSLGKDRYYAVAGAYYLFNTYRNILVIDMGTATTFNFLSNGIFKGGLISPGLAPATYSLRLLTTLPEFTLNKKISLINSHSHSAMNSGILLQQKYLIEKIITELRGKYRNLLTIITGGGYKFLKGNIEGIDVYEKNLVLKGINFITNFENLK